MSGLTPKTKIPTVNQTIKGYRYVDSRLESKDIKILDVELNLERIIALKTTLGTFKVSPNTEVVTKKGIMKVSQLLTKKSIYSDRILTSDSFLPIVVTKSKEYYGITIKLITDCPEYFYSINGFLVRL